MTTTQAPAIRPDMTMGEILTIAPAAHRALFQRYHVGGCNACGYQPTDTLARVCKDHNLLDVAEVIRTILTAQEMESERQVDATTVRAWLAAGEPVRLIDVRMPEEAAAAPFPAAEPLDYEDSGKYMGLPKETRLVFACSNGERSLDVAAYFAGHGFASALALRGGIAAWTGAGGGA
ncbi:MAG: rhodanese-like domain-containing protein [Planctomycetes bacterium]|nr:rhodanese-like domain-containing protein [Planctomycetota bacterium]